MKIGWLEESPKSKRKLSRKQEKRISSRLSGRVQAGSGSLWGNKGDVRTPVFLVEAKRTDAQQIIIKNEWLEKIRKEALKDGRIPVLGIEIGNRRYFIMEECYFET